MSDFQVSKPFKLHSTSERPLRMSTLDAIIVADAQRRIVLLSRTAESLFNCSAAKAVNNPVGSLIRMPATVEGAPAEDLLGGDRPRSVRTVGVRGDGVEFPVELDIAPLDISGARIYILCARHAGMPRNNETAAALLASIIDSSADAIVSKDLRGIVTSWNTGAVRMFGYTPNEMIGQSITRIIPTERVGEEDRILASIARGELVEHFETERRHKDGHLVSVSVTVSPIRDASGRIVGASKVARDVTLRRKLDAMLRDARDTLSLLIEQAPISIAMFDRTMKYLAVSRQWAEDYGGGSADLIGRTHYEVLPDIPERWREIHGRGLAGETLRAEEDEWQQADGTTRWIRWAVHPWRTTAGQIGGIIIFAEDITERKTSARQLRQSEAHFRQVAESLPQLIWATNAAGEFDFVSRQWVTYTGQADETRLRAGLLEHVHPADRSNLMKTWSGSVATGREFHYEFRIRRHVFRFLYECHRYALFLKKLRHGRDIPV